jgi:hypothetical protein
MFSISLLVCWKSFAVKGFSAFSDNICKCVCCYSYNRCDGNAVKGFWTLFFLSVCWFVGDNLLLRDIGRYGIIFMTVCLLF